MSLKRKGRKPCRSPGILCRVCQGPLFCLLKGGYRWGSFVGDLDRAPLKEDIDTDVEVDVDIDRYFGSLKGASESVPLLFNGIEAIVVLILVRLE